MVDTLAALSRYYDASYPPDILTGGGGSSPDPRITTLNPASMAMGTGPTTITVNGSNFDPDAQVEVEGAAQATTRVSATRLTCPYTAPASAGEVVFTVRNVGTDMESNNKTFTITAVAGDESSPEQADEDDGTEAQPKQEPEPEPEPPEPATTARKANGTTKKANGNGH